MKKQAVLLSSGTLTLAIGAVVIFGNGWATSQVLASSISDETSAKIISTSYAAQQSTAASVAFPASYAAQQPSVASVVPPASYAAQQPTSVDAAFPDSDEAMNIGDITSQPDEKEIQQSIKVDVTFPESDGSSVIDVTSQSSETKTVIRSLQNGEVILIHYIGLLADGNATGATVIYPSGKVENLDGDATAAAIERLGGLSLYDIPYIKGDPSDSDITEENAVSAGIRAIVDKYALRQELLGRYTITAIFYTVYEDIDGAVWWVDLYPTNVNDFVEIGTYTAILDGVTGEVIQLRSAADGRG